MAVSKRVRFEVFKRDSFQCQYCGRTPPAVVLHCDHVIPQSDGGPDEEENLVTACVDCNLGKSDVPLEQVLRSKEERAMIAKEKREQVEAFNAMLAEEREKTDDAIARIGYYWFNQFKKEKDYWYFGDARRPSVRRFLQTLAEQEIMECIDITFSRMTMWDDNDYKAFKYFCAVCWNKIRERS